MDYETLILKQKDFKNFTKKCIEEYDLHFNKIKIYFSKNFNYQKIFENKKQTIYIVYYNGNRLSVFLTPIFWDQNKKSVCFDFNNLTIFRGKSQKILKTLNKEELTKFYENICLNLSIYEEDSILTFSQIFPYDFIFDNENNLPAIIVKWNSTILKSSREDKYFIEDNQIKNNKLFLKSELLSGTAFLTFFRIKYKNNFILYKFNNSNITEESFHSCETKDDLSNEYKIYIQDTFIHFYKNYSEIIYEKHSDSIRIKTRYAKDDKVFNGKIYTYFYKVSSGEYKRKYTEHYYNGDKIKESDYKKRLMTDKLQGNLNDLKKDNFLI